MKRIKLLPEHLIDQIKAGEVIERPASLLKELLENSIDAGADKIDLHLIDNGLGLISIIDNGHGMTFDDLPYAFCRHATSKIDDFADIYHLQSFGFRGEALASMASVSRLSCTSTPRDKSLPAGLIEFQGGEMISHHQIANSGSCGTSIYIKDLFFNTPARLKFVKSKTSEKSALKRLIEAFVISHPMISFSIKWDDADKEIFSAVSPDKTIERLQKLFLKKSDLQDFHFFSGEYEGVRAEGAFSSFSGRGNNGKHHFLFVNHRLFNDQQLHRTVLRTLEAFWPALELGHYFLSLQVPADQIDVNVHPSKTQIKFFNHNLINSLVSSAIKETVKRYQQRHSERSTHMISPLLENIGMSAPSGPHIQESFYHHDAHQLASPLQSQSFGNKIEAHNENQIEIGSQYLILPNFHSQWPLLVDQSRLLAFYVLYQLRHQQINEDAIIPLLISEPFKIGKELDRHFDFLLHKGIELDRLTDDTVVLRSVPNYLSQFNLKHVMGCLLDAIKKLPPNEELLDQLEKSFIDHHDLSMALVDQSQIRDIMAAFSLNDLQKAMIVKLLSPAVLQQFFSLGDKER